MTKIKLIKKIFFLQLFLICFNQLALADIYQSKCKTLEKGNTMKSFSMYFSFNKKSIVISKINDQKIKYKINITQINDANKFIFNAKDEFYTFIFNPISSYIIKNSSNISNNPKKILMNKDLDEIQIKCSHPIKIKEKNKKENQKKLENDQVKLDEKNIQNILEKLKKNESIQNQDLNKILQNLNASDTKINPDQLQELFKSKSMLGKLTSKDTLQKIQSEEFLKMIKDEFQKLINR